MKTKALIGFAVTAKLICAFDFAYADCWFSHEVAQYYNYLFKNVIFSKGGDDGLLEVRHQIVVRGLGFC